MPKWPDILSGAGAWKGEGKIKVWKRKKERKRESVTYSDLIVVALVLHVLIKFFLGVKFNATHLQFLPHLQDKPK